MFFTHPEHLHTRTRNFWKFCKTHIPLPETNPTELKRETLADFPHVEIKNYSPRYAQEMKPRGY